MQKHREVHNTVAQEFLIMSSLQRQVANATRTALKERRPEDSEKTPEARRKSLTDKADQSAGCSLTSLLGNTSVESMISSLTAHDAALTAHTILAACATLLTNFHNAFENIYTKMQGLVATLLEAVKATTVVAGGRLSVEAHQGVYQSFQQLHQGYFSFNAATGNIDTFFTAVDPDVEKIDKAHNVVMQKLKADMQEANKEYKELTAATSEQRKVIPPCISGFLAKVA